MGKFLFTFPFRLAIIIRLINAPVAQLDRVLASGAKGRGFKSRLAYQKRIPCPWGRESFFCHMPRIGSILQSKAARLQTKDSIRHTITSVYKGFTF